MIPWSRLLAFPAMVLFLILFAISIYVTQLAISWYLRELKRTVPTEDSSGGN